MLLFNDGRLGQLCDVVGRQALHVVSGLAGQGKNRGMSCQNASQEELFNLLYGLSHIGLSMAGAPT